MNSGNIKINEKSFKLETLLFISGCIHQYCTKVENHGTFRPMLARLINSFPFPNEIKKQQIFDFLNISDSSWYELIKKEFEDYPPPKNEYTLSQNSLEKRQNVENWLINHIYSHGKYQNICNKHLLQMYEMYRSEKGENQAGIDLFSQVWMNLHVKSSKHENFDLYSCIHCQKDRLNSLKITYLEFEHNKENSFPYLHPDIISLFELNKKPKKNQKENNENNEKNVKRVNNEEEKKREENRKQKELSNTLCFIYPFIKIFPLIFKRETKMKIPKVIIEKILSYFFPLSTAWDWLKNKIISIEIHQKMRYEQRRCYLLDKEKADTCENHFLLVLDFCAHKANTLENVIELIVPVLHNYKITYLKFFVPEDYKKFSNAKANFVFHAIKTLIKEFELPINNIEGPTYIHCWSDNCKGDFITYNLHCCLSTLCSDKLIIRWNTFEKFHAHNISDNQAGSEDKKLDKKKDFFDNKSVYNREFIINVVSNMKNTIPHKETNIPNHFEGIDNRKMVGISQHHQFIYPHPGHIILREIYGRAGFAEGCGLEKYTQKSVITSNSPAYLQPYRGETVFKFVPIQHRKRKLKL
jgi:hypothetical protein